ncbi:MAG TPA: hypothetical protein VH206_16955 [Xanthobacteraceae bacterium]|jgi:hypothetical protein|nr:hypothetical protein [Xanthobacteraceae bacterium]
MSASIISAAAALLGAAIGGFASFLASWFAQRVQVRAQWLTQERVRRQDLYKEFIEEASKCYADALQHDKGDMPELVALYSKIGRMRVLSTPKVITASEKVARKILETYLSPDKTFHEIREMLESNSVDILLEFSEACREEFDTLRPHEFS